MINQCSGTHCIRSILEKWPMENDWIGLQWATDHSLHYLDEFICGIRWQQANGQSEWNCEGLSVNFLRPKKKCENLYSIVEYASNLRMLLFQWNINVSGILTAHTTNSFNIVISKFQFIQKTKSCSIMVKSF